MPGMHIRSVEWWMSTLDQPRAAALAYDELTTMGAEVELSEDAHQLVYELSLRVQMDPRMERALTRMVSIGRMREVFGRPVACGQHYQL